MQPKLAWNSLCRPSWPQNLQRFSWRISDVLHPGQSPFALLWLAFANLIRLRDAFITISLFSIYEDVSRNGPPWWWKHRRNPDKTKMGGGSWAGRSSLLPGHNGELSAPWTQWGALCSLDTMGSSLLPGYGEVSSFHLYQLFCLTQAQELWVQETMDMNPWVVRGNSFVSDGDKHTIQNNMPMGSRSQVTGILG